MSTLSSALTVSTPPDMLALVNVSVQDGISWTCRADEAVSVAGVTPLVDATTVKGLVYVPVLSPLTENDVSCVPLEEKVSVFVAEEHERPDTGVSTTLTVPVPFCSVTDTGTFTLEFLYIVVSYDPMLADKVAAKPMLDIATITAKIEKS